MIIVYADGACRGNPGLMAIGASIQKDGSEIAVVSQVTGEGTNNIAEYHAAIEGVRQALVHKDEPIQLRMDSKLVILQIKGTYKVKAEHLKDFHEELLCLLETFTKWSVKHIPREQNRRADTLANLAYDGGHSGKQG